MMFKDETTMLCRNCGAPISYSTRDGDYCAFGHRQYVFTTYDMRPTQARELEVSQLSEIEKHMLARLGCQFEPS
ncbi:hypothetical protein [Solilutibacter silvestris]|uniref:Uncharacterized protein n=1 Tax=Solilutibacter silvestris TaxID=1645665 RepID=A0A2K1PYH1_9GAMM|nr:hypothetical protein [Lysobacter silvestris]PNS07823.1 hypothetical protein Lysil_1999 [Lysobacter silvestris]